MEKTNQIIKVLYLLCQILMKAKNKVTFEGNNKKKNSSVFSLHSSSLTYNGRMVKKVLLLKFICESKKY